MPKDFDRCERMGGKIRTKSLPGGKYMKICIHKGKSYEGYVHEKSHTADAMEKKMKGMHD